MFICMKMESYEKIKYWPRLLLLFTVIHKGKDTD